MNIVMLSGNLTRTPEIKLLPKTGDKVCNVGMAINERWLDRDTGELRESTVFAELEAWGRQAELIGEYLDKGSRVLIQGSLKFESWETSDGQSRNRLRVRVSRVEFLNDPPDRPESDTETETVVSEPNF